MKSMFICFVGDTKIEIPELKLETAALTQFPTCVVLKHHCQENIRGEHWAYLARFLKHYSLGCVTHRNKMQPKSLFVSISSGNVQYTEYKMCSDGPAGCCMVLPALVCFLAHILGDCRSVCGSRAIKPQASVNQVLNV